MPCIKAGLVSHSPALAQAAHMGFVSAHSSTETAGSLFGTTRWAAGCASADSARLSAGCDSDHTLPPVAAVKTRAPTTRAPSKMGHAVDAECREVGHVVGKIVSEERLTFLLTSISWVGTVVGWPAAVQAP